MSTKNTTSSSDLSAKILAQVGKSAYPPVEQWDPPFCGEIDMRIHADGRWSYLGTPIERPAMVKLFSSILRLDSDNCYYLVTPVEKVRIEVEDAPLIVTEMEQGADNQSLIFKTLVDDVVPLDKDHPLEMRVKFGQVRPYVRVRSNLWALIHRNVFYRLVDLAIIEDGRAKIQSGHHWFDLGEVE